MKQYIVRQGDYLDSIAGRFGFDAKKVWEDPKNDDLRKKRPNPNILCQGDLLFIPATPAPPLDFKVATINKYVADVKTVKLQLKGPPNQPYRVKGLIPPVEDRTDDTGLIKLEIPVHVHFLEVHFTEPNVVYPVRVGYMDPIEESTGVHSRLDNLGFGRHALDSLASFILAEGRDVDFLRRRALIAFQRTHDIAEEGEPTPATLEKLKEVYGA